MSEIKVLFVCMGNICRSPTAQGIFERLVGEARLQHRIAIDSAGTHAYHVGNAPDARATEAAARRGIDLTVQRARRIDAADFAQFDYVLAMDRSNLEDLSAICPEHHRTKLRLFLEFADRPDVMEVPDPYYGGAQGFERVLDLVEQGARGLLAEIRSRLDQKS
jgi:protein-tyrosine phosphatase